MTLIGKKADLEDYNITLFRLMTVLRVFRVDRTRTEYCQLLTLSAKNRKDSRVSHPSKTWKG